MTARSEYMLVKANLFSLPASSTFFTLVLLPRIFKLGVLKYEAGTLSFFFVFFTFFFFFWKKLKQNFLFPLLVSSAYLPLPLPLSFPHLPHATTRLTLYCTRSTACEVRHTGRDWDRQATQERGEGGERESARGSIISPNLAPQGRTWEKDERLLFFVFYFVFGSVLVSFVLEIVWLLRSGSAWRVVGGSTAGLFCMMG